MGIKKIRHDRLFFVILFLILILNYYSTVLDFYLFKLLSYAFFLIIAYYLYQIIIYLRKKIIVAIKRYIRYNDKW